MSFPHPHTLSSLSEREAVVDALYRACIAFDTHDVLLLNSAFIPDAVFVIKGSAVNGVASTINGRAAIRTQLLDRDGNLDTMHTTSNVRVDLKDGASRASMTAYGMNQHCPPGKGTEADGPKLLSGSEYALDLVKDDEDGLWKVEKWAMKVIWTQGDRSVMQSGKS